MRMGISRLTKELGIKNYTLRMWEERGWLGSDVLKDPDNNNQRVYDGEQIERIKFIQEIIEQQREMGIKRTDLAEVEDKLLEKFGGQVFPVQKEEVILPATIEEFQHMMAQQNHMIANLTDMVGDLQKKELPEPINHHEDFEEMKKQLQFSREREEKLLSVIEQLQDNIEKMDKKLNQLEEIKNQMEKEKEKKGFLSKFFGGHQQTKTNEG